jgi:hypothetical protein
VLDLISTPKFNFDISSNDFFDNLEISFILNGNLLSKPINFEVPINFSISLIAASSEIALGEIFVIPVFLKSVILFFCLISF